MNHFKYVYYSLLATIITVLISQPAQAAGIGRIVHNVIQAAFNDPEGFFQFILLLIPIFIIILIISGIIGMLSGR
jgi:F0F1-type ATP synthase membrane subunit c/vacuolar-type H+-ATPase subunit K